MEGWYIEKGPESDVVISSRVRLARNFKEYPFPSKMSKDDGEKIIQHVKDAVFTGTTASDYEFMDMQQMESVDKHALMEKHLISPDFTSKRGASAAIISKDEKVSIMINEEDHLRIQCLNAGLQLEQSWELCDKIDSLINESVEYAFNDRFGYLTCCPTNLGTGIRVSAMLHLPAFSITGYIPVMTETCGKLGIAVRGVYGENSMAAGNLFQFSNQTTLGQTEDDIVNSINNIGRQIISQERLLRTELYEKNTYKFEDMVYRSLGILSNARVLSSEESFRLISDVRLGINLGIIKEIDVTCLNEIFLMTQPACLQKCLDKNMGHEERDIKRAEIIREKLKH